MILGICVSRECCISEHKPTVWQCMCRAVLQIKIYWSNIHLSYQISWLICWAYNYILIHFLSFHVVMSVIYLLSISILTLSFFTRNSAAHYILRNTLLLHKPKHTNLHFDLSLLTSNILLNTPEVQFSTFTFSSEIINQLRFVIINVALIYSR